MKGLVGSYKVICTAAVDDEEVLDVFAPDTMSFQSSVHAELPQIFMSKVRSLELIGSLVKKKKGTGNRCGAGTSKE